MTVGMNREMIGKLKGMLNRTSQFRLPSSSQFAEVIHSRRDAAFALSKCDVRLKSNWVSEVRSGIAVLHPVKAPSGIELHVRATKKGPRELGIRAIAHHVIREGIA